MLIKVVKCLNEQTEKAMKIHQYTHESNVEHYSPLRKKSTRNCHIDKDVTRNLGKLEGNEFIASRTVACHCILHAVESREPATPPFKYNGLEKKWQGSHGDNLEIATVSFAAVCIDTVLSIMIEGGFLNLKYVLSTDKEETEVLKQDKLKL